MKSISQSSSVIFVGRTSIYFRLGLSFDPMPENFGFDTNNNLFYLDSDVYDPTQLSTSVTEVIIGLRGYLDTLNEDQKQKIESYLVRLEELESKKLKK